MDKFEELKSLVYGSPTGFGKTLLGKKYAELRKWIDLQVPALSDGFFTLKTKIFWILNGIDQFPKCKNPGCGKELPKSNVADVFHGYSKKYCCRECQYKAAVANTKKTYMEKYGVESCFQLESVKEKSRKTNLRKYGVEYPGQSEEITEKRNKTNFERYGGCPMNNPDVKAKSKRTCLERYGTDSFSKTDAFTEKVRKTSLERYGVEHPS